MAFNLDKGQEAAENRFKKFGFKVLKEDPSKGFKARVRVAMDGSGSTQPMWRDGTIQAALQAVLPTALAVDDDGSLPVAVFNAADDYSLLQSPMTKDNYATFVHDNIIDERGQPKISLFGGTDYSPVIKAILKDENYDLGGKKKVGFIKSLFGGAKAASAGRQPDQDPTLLYFFTDGECSVSDMEPTRNLFQSLQAEGYKVYILFIGVGYPSSFGLLKNLATEFNNVGFASVLDVNRVMNDLTKVTDLLLPDELLNWCKKVQ